MTLFIFCVIKTGLNFKRWNVFAKRDLALAIAVQKIKNLPTRPTPIQLELIAEAWKPWRAVATQILWHYYLNCK
nr:hypothetical protein [Stanieria cyanosphaera]